MAGRAPMKALLEQEPRPVRALCPAVPAGLADAIHRALRKSPAERFADAPALKAAVTPFAGG